MDGVARHPWLVICVGTCRAGPGALRVSSVSCVSLPLLLRPGYVLFTAGTNVRDKQKYTLSVEAQERTWSWLTPHFYLMLLAEASHMAKLK